jgi:tetratricopeptide (TPR) repeat protein
VLLTASELPAPDFSRSVSTLRVTHLVKSGGHSRRVTLQPYHDRVRESITARLSAEEQRARHQRLAIALELSGERDLERLAAHLRDAGERERAADVMFEAAEQAAHKTAFSRAARLYRETLGLLADDHARRSVILARLGDALAHSGRGPQAASAYREALPGHRGPDQRVLQRKIAEQLLRSGRSDEGLAAIAELARAGGMELASSPRRAILRFLVMRARIAMRGYRFALRDERDVPATDLARIDTAWALAEALSFSDFAQGALFHATGTLASLDAGEPRRLVRAFIGEAINLSVEGRRAERRYGRAIAILDELLTKVDDPELHAAARAARGLIALAEGRFTDALDAATAAEDAYRAAGSRNRFQMTGAQSMGVWSLSMLGRVRDATGRIPELLRDARDRADLHSETTLSLSTAYWIPLLADRPDDAMALIDDALSHWSKRSMQLQHLHGLHARINVALYRGDGADAFDELEQAWPAIERSMLLRHELTRTRAWELRGRAALAAAAAAAGDGDATRPAALRVARKAARALREVRTLGAPGLVALQEAGLAAVAGDRDRAAAGLERTLADLAELNQWRRSVRWALGQLRGGTDGAAEERAAVDEIAMEGARAPERFLRMFVPWLPTRALTP